MNTAVPTPTVSGSRDFSLGGLELDEVFRGKDKLDPVQRELAVEFVRRAGQIQMERLQCLADGALLAAEQVQDVRLDLLERGPEVSASSLFWDLAIGLLLDSSLPAKLLSGFAKSTCKMWVARSAILKVDGLTAWRDAASEFKVIRTFIGSDALYRTIEEEMSSGRYLEHAKFLRWVAAFAGSADRQKDITAVAKAARAAVFNKKFATHPLEVDGDTPGVALLGAVLEHCAISRIGARFQFDRMETLIRLGFMTATEARKFLRLAEFEPLESPLKNIRDGCKLLFEALIWAKIYEFSPNNRRLQAVAFSDAELRGIDSRLVSYWMERFGHEIERWVQAMKPVELRSVGLAPLHRFAAADKRMQLSYLENYFIRLLQDLPKSIGDAETFAVTGA